MDIASIGAGIVAVRSARPRPGAAEVARLATGTREAKAFSACGWEDFAASLCAGGGDTKPVMFPCSDG